MTDWLLDTNVLSELRKPRCDRHVKAWVDAQPPPSLFISRIALAEIRYGIECLPPDTAFRGELQAWLDDAVRPWFAHRILEITEAVLVTWRHMTQLGRRRNHTFGEPDLLLAATATVHDLCVVTRNVADFRQAGVPVLDPWLDR